MDAPVFDNWWGHFLLFAPICIFGALTFLLLFLWFDRRYWARYQIRVGPNRCGPWGLLQCLADGLKMALKEDIIPSKVDKFLHGLAPLLIMFPVLMVFAIIPFANARSGVVPDLNIGLIYLVGITSIVGIGLLTAGWASSNKWSLVGAMRSIATMVSYEFPVVLSLVGVGLMAGTLSMNGIVEAQERNGWFILLQPLGFLIFFVGMMAETGRSPFDFMECESELGCGVNTEYSGLRFGIFQMVEFMEGVLMSFIVATLFLGGYSFPGSQGIFPEGALGAVFGLIAVMIKMFIVYIFLGWIKCTMPGRLRIDQWMGFAWKALLPLSVLNLIIVAFEVVAFGGAPNFPAWVLFINLPACIILIMLWSRFWTTGGGRINVRAVRQGHTQGA
ncbi:MAG: NADH-quinone oxidoreductase subunit NuoH [Chloroflexota bacterium]|nr:NADH-quinone oxidoreductase subunit NuoH [Chloroflexota bacterium]